MSESAAAPSSRAEIIYRQFRALDRLSDAIAYAEHGDWDGVEIAIEDARALFESTQGARS